MRIIWTEENECSNFAFTAKVRTLEAEVQANKDTVQMLEKAKAEWSARTNQILSKYNVSELESFTITWQLTYSSHVLENRSCRGW